MGEGAPAGAGEWLLNGFEGVEMAFWWLKFGFVGGSGGFVFRGQVFVFNGLVALLGAGVSCGARLRAWGGRTVGGRRGECAGFSDESHGCSGLKIAHGNPDNLRARLQMTDGKANMDYTLQSPVKKED